MDRPTSRSTWLAAAVPLRSRLQTAVAAINSEWQAAPPAWRWTWLVLNALAASAFLRSFWWTRAIPALPVAAALAALSAIAILCRTQTSAWLSERTTRLPLFTAATALPQLWLLGATLSHLTAFGAGCALTILGYTIATTCLWDRILASSSAFETGLPVREGEAPAEPRTAYVSETARQEPRPPVALSETLAFDAGSGVDDTVTHWQSRSQPAPGEDHLEGTLRIELAEEEKVACVHLPFAPPFAALPRFECEALADSDVRAKVAALYPYGVRIELRRSGDALSLESVELEYAATLSPASLRQAG